MLQYVWRFIHNLHILLLARSDHIFGLDIFIFWLQFSLYSLFVWSTITHQKRLGLDSIHGLSVDNQILCTSKDLSVLWIIFAVWCQLYLGRILQSWKGNNLKLVQSTNPLFKSWSNFLHQESENIQNHDCGLTLFSEK